MRDGGGGEKRSRRGRSSRGLRMERSATRRRVVGASRWVGGKLGQGDRAMRGRGRREMIEIVYALAKKWEAWKEVEGSPGT